MRLSKLWRMLALLWVGFGTLTTASVALCPKLRSDRFIGFEQVGWIIIEVSGVWLPHLLCLGLSWFHFVPSRVTGRTAVAKVQISLIVLSTVTYMLIVWLLIMLPLYAEAYEYDAHGDLIGSKPSDRIGEVVEYALVTSAVAVLTFFLLFKGRVISEPTRPSTSRPTTLTSTTPVSDADGGKRVMRTILLLAANPKSTKRVRLDEEVKKIEQGLERAKKRDQFKLVQKWAVTDDDLRRALLDNEPEIVQFSGHGGGVDGLAFEDDTGQVQLITGDALSRLFDLCSDHVKCVVLNACYSTVQAEAIAEHIDYVVGMKQKIGDVAAIKFAVGFYDALGAGRDFEKAFKFGCSAIDLKGIPEYLTPVLKKKQVTASAHPQPSSPSPSIPSSDSQTGHQSAPHPHLDSGSGTKISASGLQSESVTLTVKPLTVQDSGKTTTPVRLFYSYSHKDDALRDKLEESLALLKRQEQISAWHDRRIGAGEEWKGAIDKNLEEAQIILLLVSASFLASNYCYDIEMKRALERHERGEARVIPVILRPVDWQGAPFGKLQALPKDGKPIIKWRPRDDGLKDVAEGIRQVIKEITENPR